MANDHRYDHLYGGSDERDDRSRSEYDNNREIDRMIFESEKLTDCSVKTFVAKTRKKVVHHIRILERISKLTRDIDELGNGNTPAGFKPFSLRYECVGLDEPLSIVEQKFECIVPAGTSAREAFKIVHID